MRQKVEGLNLGGTGAPGHFLMDELEAAKLTFDDLVEALGEDAPDSYESLVSGAWSFTAGAAEKIGRLLGQPARTWLGFEEDFRAGLSAGKTHLNPPRTDAKRAGGRMIVRIPFSLHARATAMAKAEGVSLNQLVATYIAEGVARSETGGRPVSPADVQVIRKTLGELLARLSDERVGIDLEKMAV